MKYEAVFGNQELFDGAGTFTGLDVVVHSIASGIKSYARLSDLTPESLRNHPVCAMRRIIAEPKRWTVEDQKAGWLPEVGSLGLTNYGRAEYLGNDSTSIDKCHVRYEDGYCERIAIEKFTPLESPEEKAQREENEFVKSEMKNTTLSMEWSCVYERGLRAAYRKLKGGE